VALSAVTNFVVTHWPSRQDFIFCGAAVVVWQAASFAAARVPAIALNRYLNLYPKAKQEGTAEARLVALFYPKKEVEKILGADRLRNLICKVLASTAFYLTSNYSVLGAIASGIPGEWKALAVAKTFFQKAADASTKPHFLWTLHIIDLTPVIVHIVSTGLDFANRYTQGKHKVIAVCQQRIEQLGEWLEAIWLTRVIFFASPHAKLWSTGFTISAILASVCTKMAQTASFQAFFTRPMQLETITDLSQKIHTMKWDSEKSWKKLLAALEQIPELGQELKEKLHTHLENRVTQYLETVYDSWCNDTAENVEVQEMSLRPLFTARGMSRGVYQNPYKANLESIRFSLMLPMIYLIRSKQADSEKTQSKLYWQMVKSVRGEVEGDIRAEIILNYARLHQIYTEKGVRTAIQKDPFFEPLRTLLIVIFKCKIPLYGKMRELLKSVALAVEVPQEQLKDILPEIKKRSQDRPVQERPLDHLSLSEIVEDKRWR
jgi:hypothetical protein